MLDFYKIEDHEPKPHDPEKLGMGFARAIDLQAFDNLQKKGVIDRRYDFYSDFRWSSGIVLQIKKTIDRLNLGADSDCVMLMKILGKLKTTGWGLLAYGD